ncbi:cysteine peptidase family C39 domain-containing protein [Porphyromonas endodontalis]|uniref:cysteine peptidase family C39 domain-containing protein n=1 Tax=Porphyromonas endodontalis TaxID=28124 RepID=UPI0028EF798C|nr:cysteine peptidase family C39 domain-containing protein [Porphyromonas endodontalis]
MIHSEQQRDAIDCGPSCLVMLAEHYGQKVNRNQLRECCALDKTGSISPWYSSVGRDRLLRVRPSL